MTTHLRLVLTSLALSATIVAAHAEPAPARAATVARVSNPILAAIDVDRNGILSAQEIATAPLTLTALDTDGDGTISPEERRAASIETRSGRVGRGFGSFNLVFALDANHDGAIQAMEVANAVSSLQQLDRNADGELTSDELRPVMIARS